MSVNVVDPIWDISAKDLRDDSTTFMEYRPLTDRQVLPIGVVPNQASARYTIESTDVDSYIAPSKSFLEIAFKIRKVENAAPNVVVDLAANEPVTLINGAVSLFSRAIYRVNDKIIEDIDNVGKCTQIRNLLEYSDDYASSGATSEFYYKDTGNMLFDRAQFGTFTTAVTATTIAAGGRALTVDAGVVQATGGNGAIAFTTTLAGGQVPTANDGYNRGYDKRVFITGESQNVVVRIPLSRIFPFASVDRISVGVRHSIELIRGDMRDILMGTGGWLATNTPHVEISRLRWWVPHMKPSLGTEVMLTNFLAKDSEHQTTFEHVQCFSRTTTSTERSINWIIESTAERPTKVVVFTVPVTRSNDFTANPYWLDNAFVSEARIKIGGLTYPEIAFDVDFATADFARIYLEYLRCSGKPQDMFDTSSQISLAEFATVYPLFCFDLSKSLPDNLFRSGQVNDITVQLKRSANTAADFNLHAVVFSERKISLNVVSRKTLIDVL